jgi:phage FluMu protein Com
MRSAEVPQVAYNPLQVRLLKMISTNHNNRACPRAQQTNFGELMKNAMTSTHKNIMNMSRTNINLEVLT